MKEAFEKKHILTVRPSIILAKNIKQKDPVFALMNREDIEGISASFFMLTYCLSSLNPANIAHLNCHTQKNVIDMKSSFSFLISV